MSAVQHNIISRSTPAWPTQLGRYAQKTTKTPLAGPDFMVQAMQFDSSQKEVYGEWERFIHPSGAIYYYNETRNTYTGLNIKDCPTVRLENFDAWVKVMRGKVSGDRTIVAKPTRTRNVDGDVYLYYLVALEAEVIGWLEPLDGTLLFRECHFAQQWNHKRLELEAQFWKHVEFFPRNFKLDHGRVRKLRTELNWFHIGKFFYALTLQNSTSATIFSNKDVMEKIIDRLASLDDISSSDGVITEPGVALFGRLYHMLRHHQYLNHYGQPEARLLRNHSMGHRSRKKDPFSFIATIAMFFLPMLVRERLNQIYVDGVVNSLDIKAFLDDFNSQNTAQITLAGVIMAVDAGFLAVQGIGTGMVAESILKGSIIFCVGCMFAGMFAQHFGEKLKSLRFAAYYLDQGMTVVLGVFSAPRFFVAYTRPTKVSSGPALGSLQVPS
ncbi:hypothetical protein C8R48DRAFT_771535 [Suillus tomentosus]|nr:hypothetical protein C8R48DRAFT_771535 [Suillus tomentosus]